MKIVFFAHPEFLSHQSMPKYAALLANGMRLKGHQVEVLSPWPVFANMAKSSSAKKWLGYIDQYILFPVSIRKQLKNYPDDTLFVFTDHALGPWVPVVKNRPHIVHCHDFLAQLSAIDQVPENKVSRTGKMYQAYIRRGYTQGKNFISISEKTKKDLQQFLITPPIISEVVYNGLNQHFLQLDQHESIKKLSDHINIDLSKGYILHVGGNLYYKNRTGVIAIYNEWRAISQRELPLILIGETPDDILMEVYESSPFKTNIHFIAGLQDEFLNAAYSGAAVLLYPSLAEGFGWPIAEAMASGCPVITTDDAPMNEVAGDAAYFITKRPVNDLNVWAKASALILEKVITLTAEERTRIVTKGIENAKRFNPKHFLDKTEQVYKKVISNQISAKK